MPEDAHHVIYRGETFTPVCQARMDMQFRSPGRDTPCGVRRDLVWRDRQSLVIALGACTIQAGLHDHVESSVPNT